jgi:hypothetical protein
MFCVCEGSAETPSARLQLVRSGHPATQITVRARADGLLGLHELTSSETRS